MDLAAFFDLVRDTPGVARRLNRAQREAIASAASPATLIVAGPGSGKTTVLVLRALRFVIVDRVPPEQIVMTTFTIKAAKEIRSRLVEWGEALIEALTGPLAATVDPGLLAYLRTTDINRVVTGTLDSICQEALGADREPDEPPITVLDTYAARVILQRRGGLGDAWRANQSALAAHLAPYTFSGQPPRTRGEATDVVVPFLDRFVHDRVDIAAYGAVTEPVGQQLLAEIHTQYCVHLRAENLVDFAALEAMFLERLEQGRVPTPLAETRVLLVDEYQDSNALQEAIYFALCRTTGASLTVVGDDDQSLYRFRGATIELFRDFAARCTDALGSGPAAPLYLVENYRSTPEIVGFYNRFVRNDPGFGPARIAPPKPEITTSNPSLGLPVMGMFRASPDDLADSLADFLHDVFNGTGFSDPAGRLPTPLRRALAGGALGDAVFLGSSVSEVATAFGGQPPKTRFTGLLRASLAARSMPMFNPRGQALRDIPAVQQLLGLALLAIDPPGPGQRNQAADFYVTNEAKRFLATWAAAGQQLLDSPPPDVYGRSLRGEIDSWQAFAQGRRGDRSSASDWPFLDVVYGAVAFLPFFQDDPEGQIYLEAISRAAAQTAGFSGYRGRLMRDDPHRQRSIDAILRDILCPLAEDMIEVDEELMPSVPRDRLSVMTVHQAKGLEFPLVIVDVGADFRTNHRSNRFKRFPAEPSGVTLMENHLADFTPGIGAVRRRRSALDRSFEDLVRLYYVAYSRPQAALLLVGCDSLVRTTRTVPHVATWWRQDESWAWREDMTLDNGPATSAPVVAPSDLLLI